MQKLRQQNDASLGQTAGVWMYHCLFRALGHYCTREDGNADPGMEGSAEYALDLLKEMEHAVLGTRTSTIVLAGNYNMDDDNYNRTACETTLVPPDRFCYFSVLRACQNHRQPPEVAQQVLEQFVELYLSGFLKKGPDMGCFVTIISLWRDNEDGLGVETVCEKLWMLWNQMELWGIIFRTGPYHCQEQILQTFAKSMSSESIERAEEIMSSIPIQRRHPAIYHDLLKLYCNFDNMASRAERIITTMGGWSSPATMGTACNLALAACSKSKDNPTESIEIAERIFEQIPRPNPACFSRLFQTYHELMDFSPERTDKLIRAFERCCAMGQVNRLVLGQLVDNIPADTADQTLGRSIVKSVLEKNVSLAELPPEWTDRSRKYGYR
mmetsp:Transcript_7121/g.10223  ORF Transcript_7121/g.10223 Transcript_7121/m.10223 type:complete len:383 (-) Transcript_7121:76-1224(-)